MRHNQVPMLGTDPVAMSLTMNLADGAFHNYAWWGFVPTLAGRDIIWRLRSAKAAGYLAKIIEDQNVATDEKPRSAEDTRGHPARRGAGDDRQSTRQDQS